MRLFSKKSLTSKQIMPTRFIAHEHYPLLPQDHFFLLKRPFQAGRFFKALAYTTGR